MKLRKVVIFLVGVLLPLCSLSCTRENGEDMASGQISLTLSVGDLVTKAASGNPADGGGIAVDGSGNPDLVIAIVNSANQIIAWYPDGFWGYMALGYSSECITTHSETTTTTSTIYFTGPARGEYTVYAIANTEGLENTSISSLKAVSTLAELDALKLDAIPFGDVLPISAKGKLSVNASGNGQVNLELQRMFAKISLTFLNTTGEDDLDVRNTKVTIYEINPPQGYLFPAEVDQAGIGASLVIENEDKLVFSEKKCTLPQKYVFPSVAPSRTVGSRYLCDISFRIVKKNADYDAADSNTYDEYEFPNLPIHNSRSEDIQSLGRNQHLKIETRISKKANNHDISFNFEVQGWTEKEEFVTFH